MQAYTCMEATFERFYDELYPNAFRGGYQHSTLFNMAVQFSDPSVQVLKPPYLPSSSCFGPCLSLVGTPFDPIPPHQ